MCHYRLAIPMILHSQYLWVRCLMYRNLPQFGLTSPILTCVHPYTLVIHQGIITHTPPRTQPQNRLPKTIQMVLMVPKQLQPTYLQCRHHRLQDHQGHPMTLLLQHLSQELHQHRSQHCPRWVHTYGRTIQCRVIKSSIPIRRL